MHKDNQKLSMWMMIAAIACCGLPLLFIVGSGAVLALLTGFLSDNTFLIILAILLAVIAAWLFFRRKK